jgi:extradiol dioxygenase family protein
MQNFFHLAFPVRDLAEARQFYGGVLECAEGRSAEHWIDFNLYGHQIVAHLAPPENFKKHFNRVDNDEVPVPHFGVILPLDEWRLLANKLRAKGLKFIIEPHIRFQGEAGEQATMFFLDPSGNALEFKAFADFSQIFAR